MKNYFVINITKILAIYAVFHAFFSASSLGTNDDSGMALIASGGFGGTPSPRLVFINSVLGSVLSTSYRLFPSIPAYSLLALGTNIFSILLLLVSTSAFLGFRKFSASVHNTYAGVLLCISMFVLQQNLLQVNFTKTAFTASVVGLVSLQLAIVTYRKSLIYLSIFVCCLGFAWRSDAFYLAVLVSSPTLVMVLIGRYRHVWKEIGLLFSLLISLYVLNRLSYTLDENWSSYMDYNSVRGRLHGSRPTDIVVKSFGIESISQLLKIPQSVLVMFFDWFFEPGVFSKEVLENLDRFVMNSFDPFNSIVFFFPWKVLAITFATSLIVFFNLRVPLVNYIFAGVNGLVIVGFGSFLKTTSRLPEQVSYGLTLGLLCNGMVCLLATRRWSLKYFLHRSVFRLFILLRWCFFISILVLICIKGQWSEKRVVVSNQQRFAALISEFSSEDFDKPIFGIPRVLDLGTESPFKTFDLYDSGIFSTYGWIMGSPFESDLLNSYGAGDRVSLNLIDGHILLSNMSLVSLQFEQYFFDVYGRCGFFTPVYSPNKWDLGIFVEEPCP